MVDEHRQSGIGPLILETVQRIAARIAGHGYDPQVYAGVADWTDGIDDLVQQVILQALLEEGQLNYAFSVARDERDFVSLTARQVRRVLARRRQRTVIDNLIDRCKEILESPAFESSQRMRPRRYWLVGFRANDRDATDVELRQATLAASTVPQMRYTEQDRAPAIYTTQNLTTLLEAVATGLPGGVALADLDSIFGQILTDWLPGLLTPLEGVEIRDSDLGTEETVLVSEAVSEILNRLSMEQRSLLALKLANVADAELAKRFGISRPTLASRKHGVFQLLEGELRDLGPAARDAVVSQLSARLATEVANG